MFSGGTARARSRGGRGSAGCDSGALVLLALPPLGWLGGRGGSRGRGGQGRLTKACNKQTSVVVVQRLRFPPVTRATRVRLPAMASEFLSFWGSNRPPMGWRERFGSKDGGMSPQRRRALLPSPPPSATQQATCLALSALISSMHSPSCTSSPLLCAICLPQLALIVHAVCLLLVDQVDGTSAGAGRSVRRHCFCCCCRRHARACNSINFLSCLLLPPRRPYIRPNSIHFRSSIPPTYGCCLAFTVF